MLFASFHYEAILRVSKLLLEKKLMLGTAESCTGGLVASLCTEIPKSSSWFSGGVVSYGNSVKQRMLHVPESVIYTYGAVSEETARSMVTGCIVALDVNCAVAITGIAGPDGGSEDKPVGTVWIAVGCKKEVFLIRAEKNTFQGDRSSVRLQSVYRSLQLLEEHLQLLFYKG